MASINKTPNYNLNQWEGNEYPKRQDFVDDNLNTDIAIKSVDNSLVAHKAESATQEDLGHVKLPGNFSSAVLQNGATSTLLYRKDDFGNLAFRGYPLISTKASGTIISILPAEYRPTSEKIFLISGATGQTVLPVQMKLTIAGELSIRITTTVEQLFFDGAVITIV